MYYTEFIGWYYPRMYSRELDYLRKILKTQVPPPRRGGVVWNYSFAAICIVVASLLRLAIGDVHKLPYLAYILPVVIVVTFTSTGPSVLTGIVTWIIGSVLGQVPFALSLFYLIQNLFIVGIILWQKSVKEETTREREFFSTTLISIGDAVITTDSEWRIVFVNDIAETLLQDKATNLIGMVITDLVHFRQERSGKVFDRHILSLIKRGKVVTFREGVILENVFGNQILIDGSAAPVRTNMGSIGATFIIRDISYKRLAKESVQAMTAVVRSSKDAIYTTDQEGIVTSWNKGSEKMFGYKKVEVLGKNLKDLIVPSEHKHDFNEVLDKVRAGENIEPYETVRKKKDGTRIHVLYSVSYIRSESGKIFNVAIIAKDISDQYKVREELIKRQQEFEALVENAPDLISRHDRKKRYLYVNQALAANDGRAPSEYIGKNFVDVGVEPTLAKQFNQAIEKVFKSKKPQSLFYWYDHLHQQLYFHSRFVPEYNDKEEVVSVLIVSRDITEIKKAEERKDDFIAIASHELKTPLTSIRVFADVLARKSQKIPDINNHVRKMSEQIDILIRLINELLDVSRIQRGTIELTKERFPLDVLTREVVEMLQPTTSHRIQLTSKSAVYVTADKNRIRQVIINLLSNAIKYSPETELIEVFITKEKERIVLSVQDHGIGIEKKHRAKIFERFFRIYESDSKRYSGLGMGLFISHEIVKRHKGRMWLVSEKGKGSTFYFSLPASY